MGTHVQYVIAQCYLPPGRGDIPALATEAGTRSSDPGSTGTFRTINRTQAKAVYARSYSSCGGGTRPQLRVGSPPLPVPDLTVGAEARLHLEFVEAAGQFQAHVACALAYRVVLHRTRTNGVNASSRSGGGGTTERRLSTCLTEPNWWRLIAE